MVKDIVVSSTENNKPKKTKKARVRSGRRYEWALLAQHKLLPFTHIAHLNILSEFAIANFKRNLKLASKGLFDAIVFEEVALGTIKPHYHFVIRASSLTKKQFRQIVLVALRKGRWDKSVAKISLRLTKLDESLIEGGFKYQPKSTYKLVSNINLGRKYQRICFKVGNPLTDTVENLSRPYRKQIAQFMTVKDDAGHPFWGALFWHHHV